MSSGQKVTYWIYKHQNALVSILLLIALVSFYKLTQLGIDNSMDIWFLEEDPAYVEYQRFLNTFENHEMMILAVEDERGFFNEEARIRLTDLVLDLQEINGIERASSFLDFISGNTTLNRAEILDHPMIKGRMLSADGKTTAIYLELAQDVGIVRQRSEVFRSIHHLMQNQGTYHLAGLGVIYEALNEIAIKQSLMLFIATFLIITLLLWRLLKNYQTLAIALFISSISSAILVALMITSGKNINIVTMIIPTLIFIISISSCIHIFRKTSLMDINSTPEQRVIDGVGVMFSPTMLSALTSAIGFLALATSKMQIIRDLGLFTSAGLVISFICTMVFSVYFISRKHSYTKIIEANSIKKLVTMVSHIALSYPKQIIGMALILIMISVYGIHRLNVDTYTLEMLFDDHPVKVDSRAIESKIGSYITIEFVVQSDSDLFNDTTFEQIRQWSQSSIEQGIAFWAFSIPELSKNINPEHPSSNYQQLQLTSRIYGAGDIWSSYVHDRHELRVSFGVQTQSAKEVAKTVSEIQQLARPYQAIKVKPTGYMPLYSKMMDYVVTTQVQSFAIAFIVIFIVIATSFRSLRLFLLSIPSNVLPILFVMGLMGLAGINLDTATVTIAAILIGLVVDDTIHFIHYYRIERLKASTIEAIQITMNNIGYSITLSSMAFILGMLMLIFASVKSIFWFGLLIAAGMFFAFLADMLILPAILVLTDRRKLKPTQKNAA